MEAALSSGEGRAGPLWSRVCGAYPPPLSASALAGAPLLRRIRERRRPDSPPSSLFLPSLAMAAAARGGGAAVAPDPPPPPSICDGGGRTPLSFLGGRPRRPRRPRRAASSARLRCAPHLHCPSSLLLPWRRRPRLASAGRGGGLELSRAGRSGGARAYSHAWRAGAGRALACRAEERGAVGRWPVELPD